MAINDDDDYIPFSGAGSGNQLPAGIVRSGNSYSDGGAGPSRPVRGADIRSGNANYDSFNQEGVYRSIEDGVMTFSDAAYLARDIAGLSLTNKSAKAYRKATQDIARHGDRAGTSKPKVKPKTGSNKKSGFKGTGIGNSASSTRTGTSNGTGTSSGGGITSPLTELERTESLQQITSDDGLVTVTVAWVTSMTMVDGDGNVVEMVFSPPS